VRIAALIVTTMMVSAAACGGDGDSGGSGEAERSIAADAQAHAEAAVLQLSDFPDGWRAAPAEEDEEGQDEFRECIGADYSAFTITGQASSDNFSMGESAQASSQAAVFDTEEGAAGSFDAFEAGMQSEAIHQCVQKQIEESAVTDVDVEFGDIEVGELSFTPPAGSDEAGAWQLAVPFEIKSGAGAGLSLTVFVDFVIVRQGETVILVATSDVFSSFDSELRDDLVAAVAARAD
jgi:hypothetical protein